MVFEKCKIPAKLNFRGDEQKVSNQFQQEYLLRELSRSQKLFFFCDEHNKFIPIIDGLREKKKKKCQQKEEKAENELNLFINRPFPS